MAKLEKLLALSPTYQVGKKLGLFGKDKKKKAKASNTTTKQTDVGQNQADKIVDQKKRKAPAAALSSISKNFNRGGLVSKSGIMHGYKKGGQV
jgi:hypothetical protein